MEVSSATTKNNAPKFPGLTDYDMQRRTRRRKSTITAEESLYVCGCGKTYLSYAALYTHAKTKHEGMFPEGSNTGIKKKQGRPRVNFG